MTRQCAWCGAELGEKCPQCGEETLIEASTRQAIPIFRCLCGYGFLKGEGGVTHTMCEPCLKARQGPAAGLPSAADLDAAAEEQRRKEETACGG